MPQYRRKYSKKTRGPARKLTASNPNRFAKIDGYGIRALPMPSRVIVNMQYGSNFNLSVTLANIAAGSAYRMNSIYDPQWAAGGRTAVGHANMAGMYRRYLVVGARVQVTFSETNADGTYVGIRKRINTQNASQGNSMQDIAEKPQTWFKPISDSGNQKAEFNVSLKPWELMSLSKQEYMTSDSFSSAYNANPASDNCFFDVFAANPNSTCTVNCTIRVWYTVIWYDRVGLQSSILA